MAAAEFWYEFASTYSYPAAMRVAPLAKARGVALAWRPFLLGPIFAAQGWRDSPFNIYPVKGRYMWRDLERDLRRARPAAEAPRPVPAEQPARRARRARARRRGAARISPARVYAAEFGEGLPIADRATIAALLAKLGLDPERRSARGRRATPTRRCSRPKRDRAAELGLIGAPCLVTEDGEVFWGNDRLEQGLDWAAGKRA